MPDSVPFEDDRAVLFLHPPKDAPVRCRLRVEVDDLSRRSSEGVDVLDPGGLEVPGAYEATSGGQVCQEDPERKVELVIRRVARQIRNAGRDDGAIAIRG